MFGLVSKSPRGGMILEISTLRSQAPERTPTFLRGLGASFPRRAHRAPAGARPHRTRSADDRPTRGARAEPRLSHGQDGAGRLETRPRRPRDQVLAGALRAPPGLAPRDPPGSWAAATGTTPRDSRPQLPRIPGRCSQPGSPSAPAPAPPPRPHRRPAARRTHRRSRRQSSREV